MEVPKMKKKVNLQLTITTSDDEKSLSSNHDKQNLYLEEEEQPKKRSFKVPAKKSPSLEKTAPYVLVEGPEPSQDLSYKWV